MGTRCRIAFKDSDGPWRSIYVHHDGYPTGWGAGYHLKESYQSIEEARDLIALGDLSTLDKSLSKTVAYHRDWNEEADLTRPVTHDDEASVYSRAVNTGAYYLYLKDGDKPWQCFVNDREGDWKCIPL